MLECVGIMFGPYDYGVILDALEAFEAPADYSSEERAALIRLKEQLREALGEEG